ncbi:Uncharacterized protein PCOAH_00024920 [Plasmodium coatneyi]|uniref:Uncharacterized protein n=1 Tax=Plasmodium coatneyi TaxID=208452 RepID=A0A1B1E074_9APIC|nr:Uncharacterized protein PCOAH_00024920 [Plasmodium coatneyi]ANQ08432.1 Uncharacterized protein PCOAH_00024920 [Plasmodium coatneyi]
MNNPVEVVVPHLRRPGNSNGIKNEAQIESMGGSANNISLHDDHAYASDDLPGEFHTTGDVPPGGQKGRKKRMFRIKKKKSLTPLHNNDFSQGGEAKVSDVALESFAITRKQRRSPLLGKGVVESSNIQLTSKLNPTLSLVASKAVDGLLGGVHKHMQGPFSLDLDGTNNSPLANPIVTPNLYSNLNNPFNMQNGIPPAGAPVPSAPAPMAIPTQTAQVPIPNAQPQPPSVATETAAPTATAPMASPTIPPPPAATAGVPPPPGIQLPANAMAYPQMNMQNLMSANHMAQNPAFNIHPTATNLRDDPGNVNYNEVVTITIGIVICLFLFCFVFGCFVKMCKPGKRRR